MMRERRKREREMDASIERKRNFLARIKSRKGFQDGLCTFRIRASLLSCVCFISLKGQLVTNETRDGALETVCREAGSPIDLWFAKERREEKA